MFISVGRRDMRKEVDNHLTPFLTLILLRPLLLGHPCSIYSDNEILLFKKKIRLQLFAALLGVRFRKLLLIE